MKDELVTFKTAKLAKEKGFDVETNRSFKKNTISEGYSLEDFNIYDNVDYNYNQFDKFISAPTQTSLQTWLLEEHSIFVTVNIAYDIFGRYATEVWGTDDVNKILLVDGMTIFDNTFDAWEEGLQESLKLIKL